MNSRIYTFVNRAARRCQRVKITGQSLTPFVTFRGVTYEVYPLAGEDYWDKEPESGDADYVNIDDRVAPDTSVTIDDRGVLLDDGTRISSHCPWVQIWDGSVLIGQMRVGMPVTGTTKVELRGLHGRVLSVTA